jgi:predicted MPP superfamily phosphohydrolase
MSNSRQRGEVSEMSSSLTRVVAARTVGPVTDSQHHAGHHTSTRTWAAVRRCVTTFLIGVAAATVAAALAPSVTADAGPGAVEVDVRPGTGGTSIELPPLGTVTANTHFGPADINVRLLSVDIDKAAGAADANTRNAIVDSLPDVLRTAVIHHLAYTVMFAAALGTLFAAAARRRNLRRCVGASLSAIACVAATTVWTASLYDTGAFTKPKFTGLLSEAPETWRRVNTAIGHLSTLRGRLDAVASQIDALWSVPENMDADQYTTILHVSDIHLNPVGVSLTAELADRFGVDAVIDTGDVTSFGLPFEADLYTSFLQQGVDYYVVFGNHDSQDNRNALSKVLRPLDRRVETINGVTVLGYNDPTFTAKGDVDTAANERATDNARRHLGELCAEHRPDVVVVHNPNLADAANSCAPLVIAGHLHEPQHYITSGGVRVSVSGSTGAGGVGQLAEENRYEAELLRFEQDGTLVAVDVISLDPSDGQFEIERVPVSSFDLSPPNVDADPNR